MSVAQPALPGAGITVRILRDDGVTYAGATLPPELFSPGVISTKLAAATGLSAAEQARARNLLASTAHSPREPSEQGLGWAVYLGPSGLSAFIQRDDGTHLSWSASAPLFSRSRAATAISLTSGLTAAETGRLTSLSGGTLSSGSTSAQIPAQANIVGRWRTDTIASPGDGNPVGSWVDSVNGQTISQGTGANQPLYKANSYGGQPALAFDGVNDLLTGTCTQVQAAITSGEFTIMVVYGRTQATSFGFMFSATNSTGLNLANNGTNAGELSGAVQWPFNGSGFSTATHRTTQSYPQPGGTLAPMSDVWVNGSRLSIGAGTSFTPTGVGIGASPTGVGPYKGEIQEIIVWNRFLTLAEEAQAERAFRDYYAQPYTWTAPGFYYVALGDSITKGYTVTFNKQWPGNLAMTTLGMGVGPWANLGVIGATPQTMQAVATKEQLALLSSVTGVPTKYSYFEFYNLIANVTSPVASSVAVTSTQALLSQLKSVPGDKVAFGDTLDYSNRTSAKGDWVGYWSTPANRVGYIDLYVPLSANANVGADLACPNSAPYGLYFANEINATSPNITTVNGSAAATLNSGTATIGQTFLTAGLGIAAGTTITNVVGSAITLSAAAGAGAGTGVIKASGGDGVHPGDLAMPTMQALFSPIGAM